MFHAVRQNGMVALVVTMVVLGIVTMVTLFTARVIISDQKIYKNVYDRAVAQNAAQAGFDYAYGYLASNTTAVTATGLTSCASATNTYTLSAGANSPLPNGATFTMRYGCVATNTNTLSLNATGMNSDGASTNVVSALLKQVGNYAVIARSTDVGGTFSVDLANNISVINNTTSAKTSIAAGGTVRLTNPGSATTTTVGSPYACTGNKTLNTNSPPAPTTCQDISYDNTELSSMTSTGFQTAFLGRTLSSFQSIATYNVDCSSGGNKVFYSGTTFTAAGCTCSGPPSCALKTLSNNSVNGITGNAIIYMNMGSNNLTITTNNAFPTFTLGTLGSPIILVVNGTNSNVIMDTGANDTLTIYGNVYVGTNNFVRLDQGGGSAATRLNGILFGSAAVQVRGGAAVNGVVVGDQVAIQTNGTTITYTPANITNTYGGYYGVRLGPQYGVVSGSWKDF